MLDLALDTQVNRDSLIRWFPNLGIDRDFHVTSPVDFNFNCIAFAMGFEDRWVDYPTEEELRQHGIQPPPGLWWPDGVERSDASHALVEAFIALGFVQCHNGLPEDGFDKVVLYENNGCWTHAAKITTFPVAHSKFGQSFDGLHTFDAVRDSSYGDPYAFMKRAIADRIITEALKQKIGTPRVLKKPVWRK